jgi:hypothetical protein
LIQFHGRTIRNRCIAQVSRRTVILCNLLICTGIFCIGVGASPSGEEPDWFLLESNDTLVLFFKDARVGTLNQISTVDAQKKCIIVTSKVAISSGSDIPGTVSSMELTETRTYDFSGVQSYAFQELKSPSGTSTWELQKEGDAWMLSIFAGGMKHTMPVKDVRDNLAATYAIRSAVIKGTAAVGDVWRDTVYDLTAGMNLIITMQCTAVPDTTHPYYVVINRDNVLKRDERWEVDKKGSTVLQEVPPFFTARRLTEYDDPTRTSGEKSISLENLTELFKISVARSQKENETIAVTLDPEANLHTSIHRFYTQKNNTYVLNRLQEQCTDTQITETTTCEKGWLKSTVTIQADHPEIVALAGKLKGKKKSRCEIIRYFNEYLYENIKKEHVASFSNAYETLKAGRGDCGEHAALLAALLRAVDIEAQVVLGLVYMPFRKGYYYHAWVAAYADNLIFADPALGVFPAYDGYIPLVLDEDGTNIVHLASLIERIRISYVKR